jgi:NADH:ubiquinone oxidoreductase subunit 4 (subunit M)
LIVILLVWLSASWYFFKMTQRLLFGPHRTDIPYEDLRRTEAVSLLAVLLALAALGLLPYGFFDANALSNSHQTVMEFNPWTP